MLIAFINREDVWVQIEEYGQDDDMGAPRAPAQAPTCSHRQESRQLNAASAAQGRLQPQQALGAWARSDSMSAVARRGAAAAGY